MADFDSPSSVSGARPYQRRWRNYLLNWRYQLRYTFTMVAVSGILFAGLGMIVVSKTREASRIVEIRSMDPTDEFAQSLKQQFADNDRVMITTLIGFGAALSLILTAFGIVSTHRVAGPLYKVSLYLDRIQREDLGPIYSLRKGDQLGDFFEHFRAAHRALRERTQEDIALFSELENDLGASHPLTAKIHAARQRKQLSLKDVDK